MPTEMGSPLFAGWRSEKDAACVSALRQAGAVILGKTVTTEFAATEPRGTRNPWNLEHTPGGSSSGSAAAVGCGMVSAGARHAGDRLDHPAGELLRRLRLQAVGERAQPRRLPRLPEPELHRHHRGDAGGHLAGRARDRQRASAATPARRGWSAPTPALPRRSRSGSRSLKPPAGRTPSRRRKTMMQEALKRLQERRHRDRDAPRRCEDRRGRDRDRRRASAVEQDQQLRDALVPARRPRPRRREAQQGHADAARGKRGADASPTIAPR